MTRLFLILLITSAAVLLGCDDATDPVSQTGRASSGGSSAAGNKTADENSSKATSGGDERAKEAAADLISELIQAEDLVLDLTFRLRAIGRWWEDRSRMRALGWNEPDPTFGEFKALKKSQDLIAADALAGVTTTEKVCDLAEQFRWPTEAQLKDVSDGFGPMQPLLRALSDVEDIKFGVLRGQHTSGGESFVTELLITGKGILGEGPASFEGHHELHWEFVQRQWQIVQWRVLDTTVTRAAGPIFEDVLDEAIPVPLILEKLRRSYHQELMEVTVNTGNTPIYDARYKPYVGAVSPHSLPSISVVDYNADGWDDLFVSARWGPTQLLKNNGDGTFEDVTREAGISLPKLVNCSVFVDLDNDGDQDVVVGRALEPIVYLRNDGGTFTDVTASHSDLSDQYMVSAISVADINRDGLLDLYLSTYGPSAENDHLIKDRGNGGTRFLTEQQRETLTQLDAQEVGFVDHAGPPNVMVINRGQGKLERVAGGDRLIAQWHHSYQSAWADVDDDGDDDLYIANDFAQDALLLNETPQGASEPVFRDGLEATFVGGGTGFGMGASWGDFDSDGDLDLYVSNMYSKAGTRILKTLGEGDPRFEIATRGNFLYENQDGKFVNRAGTGQGRLNVGKVGWSYGGQFVDFDNNGGLDLYVPSGYFTAIAAADTKVDI